MNFGMIDLFVRRIAGFVLVLFVLSLIIFALARIVPGDPARIAMGPRATQEQVDAMRQSMGLDQPLITQYLTYVTKLLHGDLGQSLLSRQPVLKDIVEFLPATLELVLATVIVVFLVSIPLGVLTSRYRNQWIDHAGRFFSLVGVAMPSFLVAILLQLFAARFLPGWPILGRMDHNVSMPAGPTGLYLIDSLVHLRPDVFLTTLQYLLLPTLSLAFGSIGQITRITRSAMIENQRKDHVLTLRSFGVPTRVIVFRYLLKLSSIAPLTILGLEFASLIGNAFVVEMVFSWGGFASYGLTAILQKDINAVMAVVLVSGCFFVVANLVIDVVLAIIDPRMRLREAR